MVAVAAEEPPERVEEGELRREVLALCFNLGLAVYYCHDSRRSIGRGFPDLVIAGDRGVLFRELKGSGGGLRPDQRRWIRRLSRSRQDVRVWWPADLASGAIRVQLEAIR